jgi:hypothetical protein
MDAKEQANVLDLIIRVFCLEKILIEKNLITKEELVNELNSASERIVRDVLKAANYSGDIEKAVGEFQKKSNNSN